MAEKYPLPKFHFQVEWGGTNLGFSEVSGLDVETEVIEYRHGASPDYSSVKMPGRQKYSNITLKRGTTKADNEYFDWWNTVQLNTIERRDITISLLNENHEPVVVWKVKNAWPSASTAPMAVKSCTLNENKKCTASLKFPIIAA